MTNEQYKEQLNQYKSMLESLIQKHAVIYRRQSELMKEEQSVSSEIEKIEKAMAAFCAMFSPLFENSISSAPSGA